MLKESYTNNPLAEEIYQLMVNIGFGGQFKVEPVINQEAVTRIKDSSLQGLDYRSKTVFEPGFGTVFTGLAFDPENIRTQATAIYDKEKPIGLMTHVIAPRAWVSQQRYFERVDDGIVIRDFRAVSGNIMADYLIIPGWTILDRQYRFPRAIIKPGFEAFKQIISLLKSQSPNNTFIEAAAMGKFPPSQRNLLLELVNREVGTFISKSELPFELDEIGQNAEGSMASVNMAEKIGLSRIADLGSGRSLGPVFAKIL
jgi:hypothetical protein